jgi:putative oxidoreductase
VSTYDDDGLFYPNKSTEARSSTYNSAGRDPASATFDSDDELYTGSDDTTMMAPGDGLASSFDEDDRKRQPRWTGSADFGLLVLRIVLGGTFLGLGLQHLFGLFHGIGIHDFETLVRTRGYTAPTMLAWVAGGAEVVGGALVVLGLFTPLGAAALLAVLANVIVLKWPHGFFAPAGYELEMVLGAAAFALLFTGPGRVSLDRPTPWFRRPGLSGFIFLVIGAAVAIVFLFVLRNH